MTASRETITGGNCRDGSGWAFAVGSMTKADPELTNPLLKKCKARRGTEGANGSKKNGRGTFTRGRAYEKRTPMPPHPPVPRGTKFSIGKQRDSGVPDVGGLRGSGRDEN